ncbi:hypothetical protein AB0F72_17245 [Actinoplanes sp. NPDC023936]|uniref:hypothetical protein n=1 Tax=Actinoplanes sp. NPDC023936 TaxID=3154910 RepID=UPI0033FA4BB3
MSRSVFEDGRILRTSDFVADQADHLTRHRLHNNSQHRWGIVAGLEIVNVGGELVVQPGRAVDGYGRDLVLTSVQTLDLRLFEQRDVEDVDVWIVYRLEILRAAGDGVDRVSDGARIELDDAQPLVDVRRPPGVPKIDLEATPPVTTDDPGRRWPVFLGRVTRNSTKEDGEPEPVPSTLPYAGLIGATVQHPNGDLWIDLGATTARTVAVKFTEEKTVGGKPTTVTATPLTVGEDGVVFDRQLTVQGDLVLRGGSLAIESVPATPAGTPQTPIPDWSITHIKAGTDHELRITMPDQAGALPTRLTVGQVRDGEFVANLTLDENGTMMITGNLIVGGNLKAAKIQEAELSDDARAQLAAVQANSLLAIFTALRSGNP